MDPQEGAVSDMKGPNSGRIARAMVFVFATGAIVAMLAGVAHAGDSTATATLSGGSLYVSQELAPGSFSGSLTGAAHQLTGTGFNGFNITDARASGVGWEVTVQATQFINVTHAGHDIALDSFTMPHLSVVGESGSSPVPGTLGPAATIDTGTSGVQMAACDAAGQGMGVYDFTAAGADWKLDIAADQYSGSYDSTVTLTLSTLAF